MAVCGTNGGTRSMRCGVRRGPGRDHLPCPHQERQKPERQRSLWIQRAEPTARIATHASKAQKRLSRVTGRVTWMTANGILEPHDPALCAFLQT
ncbi:hypothetical protein HPB50_012275 [Hyalomma asiaticum]|uniref:Uncharacterized protein n=1 Tax=Hyalomma asiaticum TaxID=266040 RepID=A0ACB7S676_HYAAI|nr:hypothetical protein HPB50_012275 [Hyalomma asiaticum]